MILALFLAPLEAVNNIYLQARGRINLAARRTPAGGVCSRMERDTSDNLLRPDEGSQEDSGMRSQAVLMLNQLHVSRALMALGPPLPSSPEAFWV